MAKGQTVADQIAFLDRLEALLQTRRDQIVVEIKDLEPQILRLQADLRQAENELDRLNREVKLAKSLYESLSLKTEEARIASESEAGVSRLASEASIPNTPIGPRKLVNTVVGAGLGFVIGLALAVLLELLGRSRTASDEGNRGNGS
jgi:uncharacterized protein involved in exopolysaccharide biosynthesis